MSNDLVTNSGLNTLALPAILKIFGLFPFSIERRRQMLLNVQSLFLIFIIIIIFVVAFFVKNIFEKDPASSLVSGLVFFSHATAHITTMAQAFLTKQKQYTIFECYDEIDNDFRVKLQQHINSRAVELRLRKKILTIMIVLSINICVLIQFMVTTDSNTSYYYSFFTVISLRLRMIQCFAYIELVSERFAILNGILSEFIAHQSTLQKNIFTISAAKTHDMHSISSEKTKKILALKHIYNRLWDTVNLINECFGWSLLAIITSYFLDFTCNAYWLFMAIEEYVQKEAIWKCLNTMFPLVLLMGYLSYGCQNCSNKGDRTGNLVNKLEKCYENEKYNALISEFSLQIIHEPISVTANGFFTINFNLLGSMAAATVTYLVILIQFWLSENAKKGEQNLY